MSLLVLDNAGELWNGQSRQLHASFGSPYSGGEFIEYAVKNLGFVAINTYGRSCQVRLRPGFVGERTAEALFNWLVTSRTERVVLSVFERGWRDQLLRTDNAPSRIGELLNLARQAAPTDFLARSLGTPSAPRHTELNGILAGWRFLVANYDQDTVLRLLRLVFGERFVALKTTEAGHRLVFAEIGSMIYSDAADWQARAIGAPIEEQPDRNYGRWVATAYEDMLDRDAPTHDAVDAIMRLPRRGRMRVCYQRFLFPITDGSAGKLIVGGSIPDPAIDLRAALG